MLNNKMEKVCFLVAILFCVGCKTTLGQANEHDNTTNNNNMQDARYFKQDIICDIESRIAHGCFNLTSNSRGLIDCLTVCNDENACVGAGVAKNDSSCFIHTPCPPEVPTCMTASLGYDYYSKNCDNSGTWNKDSQSCVCTGGWVGEHCNRHPKNCDELITYGYFNMVYRVTLDLTDKNLPETEVFCKIDPAAPSSSIVVMRSNGQVDNSETFQKYRRGFESGAYNVWLGLDRWHVLSSAGYNVMEFSSTFSTSPDPCTFTWRYDNFRLSGIGSNFSFSSETVTNETTGSCGGYRVGDCFTSLENVSFSTEDLDNDLDDVENCAQLYGSGWWWHGGLQGPGGGGSCQGGSGGSSCHLMGWKQSYKGSKPDQMLNKVIGINSDEMMTRLTDIQLNLKTNG